MVISKEPADSSKATAPHVRYREGSSLGSRTGLGRSTTVNTESPANGRYLTQC